LWKTQVLDRPLPHQLPGASLITCYWANTPVSKIWWLSVQAKRPHPLVTHAKSPISPGPARQPVHPISAKTLTQDMDNNKSRFWLVKCRRTASLQIAYVAGPHCVYPDTSVTIKNCRTAPLSLMVFNTLTDCGIIIFQEISP
jgi:hypothetical protein